MSSEYGRAVPEGLGRGRGLGWSVRPGVGGSTDLEARVMVARADVGPCSACGFRHGERVRAHEVVHARYSPDRADLEALGVAEVDQFLHLAEEVRINRLHRLLGAGAEELGVCPGVLLESGLMPRAGLPVPSADSDAAGRLAAASALVEAGTVVVGSACAVAASVEEPRWWRAFGRRYPRSGRRAGHPLAVLAGTVRAIIGAHLDRLPGCAHVFVPEWDAGEVEFGPRRSSRWCRWCRERRVYPGSAAGAGGLDAWEPRAAGPLLDRAGRRCVRRGGGFPWSVALADDLRRAFLAWVGGLEGVGVGRSGGGEPGRGRGPLGEGLPGHWGRLEVVDLEAARTVPGARPPWRLRRFDESGTVPTRVDRLTVDLRVFAPRRKRAGGAVLVDASGSMSFGAADLRALVDACPAAVVGVYSGEGESGVLQVVARDGFVLPAGERLRLSGHQNVVDGPALAWLGGEVGPRVWLSDGAATGPHDRHSLDEEAASICAAVDAVRVDTFGGVLVALREGQARGMVTGGDGRAESRRRWSRFDEEALRLGLVDEYGRALDAEGRVLRADGEEEEEG